jgi:hypothetical protein
MATARRDLDLMGCHVKCVPAERDSEFCMQGLVLHVLIKKNIEAWEVSEHVGNCLQNK